MDAITSTLAGRLRMTKPDDTQTYLQTMATKREQAKVGAEGSCKTLQP